MERPASGAAACSECDHCAKERPKACHSETKDPCGSGSCACCPYSGWVKLAVFFEDSPSPDLSEVGRNQVPPMEHALHRPFCPPDPPPMS